MAQRKICVTNEHSFSLSCYTIRHGTKKKEKKKKKHNRKSLTAKSLQQINISPNLFESVNFEHVTNQSVTDVRIPISMKTNTPQHREPAVHRYRKFPKVDLIFVARTTRIQNTGSANQDKLKQQRKMATNNFLKYFSKMDRLMMMMIYEFILLQIPLVRQTHTQLAHRLK